MSYTIKPAGASKIVGVLYCDADGRRYRVLPMGGPAVTAREAVDGEGDVERRVCGGVVS